MAEKNANKHTHTHKHTHTDFRIYISRDNSYVLKERWEMYNIFKGKNYGIGF